MAGWDHTHKHKTEIFFEVVNTPVDTRIKSLFCQNDALTLFWWYDNVHVLTGKYHPGSIASKKRHCLIRSQMMWSGRVQHPDSVICPRALLYSYKTRARTVSASEVPHSIPPMTIYLGRTCSFRLCEHRAGLLTDTWSYQLQSGGVWWWGHRRGECRQLSVVRTEG